MSRVTHIDTRHWQVAQTVGHVMLDHMSSSGVMHRDGRQRREGMVKHEIKKENIAAVHAWYHNTLSLSVASNLNFPCAPIIRVHLSHSGLRAHIPFFNLFVKPAHLFL